MEYQEGHTDEWCIEVGVKDRIKAVSIGGQRFLVHDRPQISQKAERLRSFAAAACVIGWGSVPLLLQGYWPHRRSKGSGGATEDDEREASAV